MLWVICLLMWILVSEIVSDEVKTGSKRGRYVDEGEPVLRLRRSRCVSVEDVEAAVGQGLTGPGGLRNSTSSMALANTDPARALWSSNDDTALVEDLADALTGEQSDAAELVPRSLRVGDEIEGRDAARRTHAGKVVEDETLGRCKVLLEGRGSARTVDVQSLVLVREGVEVAPVSLRFPRRQLRTHGMRWNPELERMAVLGRLRVQDPEMQLSPRRDLARLDESESADDYRRLLGLISAAGWDVVSLPLLTWAWFRACVMSHAERCTVAFFDTLFGPCTGEGDPHFQDREYPRCVREGGDAELIQDFRMLVAWYVKITLRSTVFLVEWFRETKGLGVRAVGNVRYDAMRMALPGFLERVPRYAFFLLENGGHTSIFRTGGEYFVLFGPLCLVNNWTPTSVVLGAPSMSTDVLTCAEAGHVVRDSGGEHKVLRLKADPVSKSEERSRRHVFEAGREVLMDYGSGIQSTDEDFLKRVLAEFEAGGAAEEAGGDDADEV